LAPILRNQKLISSIWISSTTRNEHRTAYYQVLALDDDAILRPNDPLDEPGLPLVLASDDHHLAVKRRIGGDLAVRRK
jgi:hypothetical protein